MDIGEEEVSEIACHVLGNKGADFKEIDCGGSMQYAKVRLITMASFSRVGGTRV